MWKMPCASGGSAVYLARNEIASGASDVAMVLGAEKLTDIKGFLPTNTSDYNGMNGLVMPASYAMVARAHMEKYGTTAEQIAMVSVKNHKYGCLNPRAQFKKPVTLEEVLSSRMICDPIHLYECCPHFRWLCRHPALQRSRRTPVLQPTGGVWPLRWSSPVSTAATPIARCPN